MLECALARRRSIQYVSYVARRALARPPIYLNAQSTLLPAVLAQLNYINEHYILFVGELLASDHTAAGDR